MLAVAGTPQLVVLDHEQNVPLELRAHVCDETGGYVRVHIQAGLPRDAPGVRTQF